MSRPRPTTRRRWREATVKGRSAPAEAPRPLLHVAVACLHAEGGGAWASCQE
jgi:hypothetical protein